jgi:GNAT superfamily N-acetyltransferase
MGGSSAMTGLHIRDARAADRDVIEAVTLTAYQQYAALMPTPYWEAYRENIRATLADLQSARQIVAELEGAIAGSVLLYPAGAAITSPSGAMTQTSPEVRLLAVDPAARGRGIGQALMRECIGRARGWGAKTLTLHTADFMEAAMRLYGRLGFERHPDLDFEPAPGAVIRGYQLNL